MSIGIILQVIYLLWFRTIFIQGGYEDSLYDIALQAYRNRNRMNTTSLSNVHLLRVPKAGSSSLSIVARRMVGCEPPGPCCKFPGDPPGSCPNKRWFDCQVERRVIGCTAHNPEYDTLRLNSIPSITIVREPISRSISGFYYPNHHDMNCKADQFSCFKSYLRDRRYQNILVKMFTGSAPYSFVNTCQNISDCRHSLQAAVANLHYFQFIGLLEMWELSLVVFHHVFPSIRPKQEEFWLYAESNRSVYSQQSLQYLESVRVNRDQNYSNFQSLFRAQYQRQLSFQNQYDLQLYALLVQRFCQEVKAWGLWDKKVVRDYWQQKSQKMSLLPSSCDS